MKIAVFGPREFRAGGNAAPRVRGDYYSNYSYIASCLDEYEASCIISGGGHGVEQLALRYANEKSLAFEVVPPHISSMGEREAFTARNQTIIDMADVVVIFWDGADRYYHKVFAMVTASRTLAHLRHME